MNTQKFEKDMAVFSLKQQREALIYLNQLELKGWTIEDAKLWIAEQKRKQALSSKQTPILSCSECNSLMTLLGVNTNKANQTGDLTDKSVWLCKNLRCMHTIYNKQTIEELTREV